MPTSEYQFVDSNPDFIAAAEKIGFPIVKPVMSSSGKGQSVIRSRAELDQAWDYSQQGGRAGQGRVIVEKWLILILKLHC